MLFNWIKELENILSVLNSLDKLRQETPPETTKSRFGNKAFVTLFDKVEQVNHPMIRP